MLSGSPQCVILCEWVTTDRSATRPCLTGQAHLACQWQCILHGANQTFAFQVLKKSKCMFSLLAHQKSSLPALNILGSTHSKPFAKCSGLSQLLDWLV